MKSAPIAAAAFPLPFVCSLLLWVFCALLGTAAQAAEVTDLYQATVPVTSRDNERERVQAFGAALRSTLVRLTGRADSSNAPIIQRAIAAPQPYVETWLYRSEPAAEAGQGEQIVLQVSFFQPGIQRLLNDAGMAVWPQNRPDTLLWVVVQDELGQREFAAPGGSAAEVLAELQRLADERGLPLTLPVLDFEDRTALRPEQLWNLDADALRLASARYGIESILALRIYRLLNGEVIAKAAYLFRDQVREQEVLESPLAAFLETSVSMAAGELAGYYAVLLSGIDSSTDLLLTVDGIDSARDYAALLQYLEGLDAVNQVQIRAVQDSSVELQLRTGGQFRQLIESMALDRRMSPLGEVARENSSLFMHYEWLGQ